MTRRICLLFGGAVLLVGLSAAPAFADMSSGAPHNCVGEGVSYTAQGNDISPFTSAHGIGNVATANDASTRQVIGYIKNVVC
jgi:hypothetical protein